MWFVKVSIGFFLLRLTVHRVHIRIIWTAMMAIAITGIVFTFVTLFQCQPVSYFWTRVTGSTTGQCLDIFVIINLTYFYSAVNALCDFTFGLLPVFLVWNLNMSRRMKIAIAPILSMACIASCAILVRTAYCRDYLKPDFLYATVDIAIWSTVECGLAITAGSLATLRPLIRVIRTKLRSHASGNSGGNSDHTGSNKTINNRRPERVWPSSQGSKERKKGGPWILLQTEQRDFEMMTNNRGDVKKGVNVDVESVRTASASERGLVIEREIEVDVERSERVEAEAGPGGKRRSWLQFKS
ncbi:hypothetical protein MPH_06734 [Macrophomina phaseolina MS6]|uniref:Rhodopsin domain-containing protein n=1 Tax=Macrophomina phaseolina (strain MS6) TaxID=1126212 RepID=K2SGV9_MACPH|nr:hypothetical protein MPH_06734 [Macrophomina phaseolina MS6]